MNTYKVCPVCRSPCTTADKLNWSEIDCFRCGNYKFRTDWSNIIAELKLNSESRIALASSWIREHQNELIKTEPLLSVMKGKTNTVGEKAEKILLGLKEASSAPGDLISVATDDSYYHITRSIQPLEQIILDSRKLEATKLPLFLMGISKSQSLKELSYLLNEYLTKEKRYVISLGRNNYVISPVGWAHLDEVGKTADSTQAFVAMWFSDDTDNLWTEGISPAIEAAGYKPFRIDKHDHNNRIDDEIIAAIRRSKFLVADFTGQRGGVYFEAGFALGLGQQVIWLCREDVLNEVHFDTRQYNHITWENDKLPELARALKLRIEATIGRGPYQE